MPDITASFTPHADWTNVRYTPGDQTTYTPTTTAGQRCSVYYPTGNPQDWGWSSGVWPAAYLYCVLSGGTTSSNALVGGANTITVTQGHFWELLNMGIPVIVFQVTPWQMDGPAPGYGMLHAPGGVDRRWESAAYPNAYKDVIHMAQWFMYNARDLGIAQRFGIGGNSSGADAASVVALSPNRAGELGTGGQYDMRTVPSVFFAGQLVLTWWDRYTQAAANFGALAAAETGSETVVIAATANLIGFTGSTETITLTGGGTWTNTPPAGSWVKVVSTGLTANPNSIVAEVVSSTTTTIVLDYNLQNESPSAGKTIAITQLSDAETPAATLGDAVERYKDDLSVWSRLPAFAGPVIPPTFAWSDTGPSTNRFGEPFEEDDIPVSFDIHSCTNLVSLKAAFPDRVHLTLSDVAGASTTLGVPSENSFVQPYMDEVLTDYDETGKAGLVGGSLATFVKKHIVLPPWDLTDRPIEINRRGQVETTGRVVMPAAANRSGAWVTNVGASISLFIGNSSYSCVKEVTAGSTVFVPGGDRMWMKSASSVQRYWIQEVIEPRVPRVKF